MTLTETPLINGPLHAVCNILRNVVASLAEVEVGGLFVNVQKATIFRTTLEELYHPQPTIPIKTDNSATVGIANKTICQCKPKSTEILFYWIQDRVKQGQFIMYWRPG